VRRDAVEAVTNPDEAFVVANGASGPANNLGEDFAFVDVAGVVDVVDAVEAAAVAVLA
jgi:hypothetical protein